MNRLLVCIIGCYENERVCGMMYIVSHYIIMTCYSMLPGRWHTWTQKLRPLLLGIDSYHQLCLLSLVWVRLALHALATSRNSAFLVFSLCSTVHEFICDVMTCVSPFIIFQIEGTSNIKYITRKHSAVTVRWALLGLRSTPLATNHKDWCYTPAPTMRRVLPTSTGGTIGLHLKCHQNKGLGPMVQSDLPLAWRKELSFTPSQKRKEKLAKLCVLSLGRKKMVLEELNQSFMRSDLDDLWKMYFIVLQMCRLFITLNFLPV